MKFSEKEKPSIKDRVKTYMDKLNEEENKEKIKNKREHRTKPNDPMNATGTSFKINKGKASSSIVDSVDFTSPIANAKKN